MKSNILISNPQEFEKKLNLIISWGSQHLHIIADFDRTLTKAFVNWEPKTALISIIQDKWYLGPDFSVKSKENFNKYHPIEIDPSIPFEEKKQAMHSRWKDQFELILKSWLTKDIIKHVVDTEEIPFRDWYSEFFDLLKSKDIPLIIFSSSGMWYEWIYYTLQKIDKLSDNIHIISNAFIRDENNKVISIREPIVHSLNKDETAVRDFPVYQDIKQRKNILILWDSPWDADMANGFDYENILKIWFLNHDNPVNREIFLSKFDMLILGDWPMDEINKLIQLIVKSE